MAVDVTLPVVEIIDLSAVLTEELTVATFTSVKKPLGSAKVIIFDELDANGGGGSVRPSSGFLYPRGDY